MSRAAAELRVAQPSVSRTLARLEADLGVPLFDRHGRRLVLNRFGTAFLARVNTVLDELGQGRQELDDLAGLHHGSVAVAAETLLLLTDLLAGFLAEHPGINVQLTQSPTPDMAGLLKDGQVDFCLASQPLDDASLQAVELLTEDVLLAVPPSHHLANRKRVNLDALAGEAFITTKPGYWQRALLDKLCARAGIQPVIACESDEPAAVRPLIATGLGVGLLPALARSARPRTGVKWLHITTQGCQRTLHLLWRREAYLSVAAQRFREAAVAHFHRLGSTP